MMGRKNMTAVPSEGNKKGSMKQLLKALKPYIPQKISLKLLKF